MNMTSRSMTPYWNWIGSHDLALLVNEQGVLWKFRAAGQGADPALDAYLEDGELVITRSRLDAEDSVEVRIHDHVVDFACNRAVDGLGLTLSAVSLPGNLELNEACSTTSRRDGVVEVRVPLAMAPAAEQSAEEPAAGPAVLAAPRAA